MGDMTVADADKYMNNPYTKEEQTPGAQAGIRRFLPALGGDRAQRRVEELEMKIARSESEFALLRTEVDGLRKELITSTVKLEQLMRQQETAEQRAAKSQVPTVRPGFTFTQVDVSGRFREIIRERFVRELGLRIRALPQSTIQTAMVIHERKGVKRGDLHSFLHGGNSRISDDFYPELQTLEDARLVVYSKDTGTIHWALGEYLKRELSSFYDEAEIKQAEDYLASLLLPAN